MISSGYLLSSGSAWTSALTSAWTSLSLDCGLRNYGLRNWESLLVEGLLGGCSGATTGLCWDIIIIIIFIIMIFVVIVMIVIIVILTII